MEKRSRPGFGRKFKFIHLIIVALVVMVVTAAATYLITTGGFGAQANARGRTCYCISLYDGRKTSFYRTDFLGVMEEKRLPEWAQKGLEKAKEMHAQEKKPTKERGDAR